MDNRFNNRDDRSSGENKYRGSRDRGGYNRGGRPGGGRSFGGGDQPRRTSISGDVINVLKPEFTNQLKKITDIEMKLEQILSLLKTHTEKDSAPIEVNEEKDEK